MTADIGPGVMLEALETFPSGNHMIQKGRIYTCTLACEMSECRAHGESCALIGVHLREAPVPLPWAHCSEFFRPIRRPDTDKLMRRLAGDPFLQWEGPVRRTEPEHQAA